MDDFMADNMWDTHIHCLDPVRYPFKPTRSYTPPPAPLDALVKNTIAKNIVLVQASVEDGRSGLVNHLYRIRSEYPDFLARGIISLDEDWDKLTEEQLDTLHSLGVRFFRIHGYLGDRPTDIQSLQEQIKLFARSYAFQKLNWGISAQLPFTTWLALRPFLCETPEISQIPIIIDHVGCSSPADIQRSGLDEFIALMQRGQIYVKISSLYRRDKSIINMRPIIQRLAADVSSTLLWGSDWPHVVSSYRGQSPPPPSKAVDSNKELRAIRDWISAEHYRAMLVDNPRRLFDP